MKKLLVIATCLLFILSVSGQSKKDRKKYKIRSTTEYETVREGGKAITYKSAYEEFDREGHSVLSVGYNADGSVMTKVTAKYDNFKNKTEETEFDASKRKSTRKTYKYNAFRDKTEEVEYDGAGNLVKKTTYGYDSDGNRTTEVVYDGNGNIQKKMIYTSNGKGLKTGKHTLNGQNSPVSEKKWEYEYY